MDIARLKEQYLWIKEKQMHQTRVVLFQKAPSNEEICGKSLVNMVPVNQEMRNTKAFEEQLPVKEIQYNFLADLDNDKTPWRTHLGIHRMTHAGSRIKSSDTNVSRTTPNPTNLTATKDFCQECTGESQEAESITSEKLNGLECLKSGDKSGQVTPASRKSYFLKPCQNDIVWQNTDPPCLLSTPTTLFLNGNAQRNQKRLGGLECIRHSDNSNWR